MHHLDSWIKIDQFDVNCFIISLFNAQHVSDFNTSILRSLRLICLVISWLVLLWFNVCWCHIVVWLGWCGIRMRAEVSARIRIPHVMSMVMVSMAVLICTFSSWRTKTWSVVLLNKKTHILLSQVYCVWQFVKTPTILSNNPVLHTYLQQFVLLCLLVLVYVYALKTVIFQAVCYLGNTERWQHRVWIIKEAEKFEVVHLKLSRLTAIKYVTKMPRLLCLVTRQVNCWL